MSIDAIRYKTFNNVIDTIKCVGTQHQIIKSVTTGDIDAIDLEKNTLFPLMHIDIVSVNVLQSEMKYNFQIFFCDLVEPDLSNEQDVLSDTLLLATDVIGIFKQGEILYHYATATGEEARYWTDTEFILEPFTERFSNALTGWVFQFPIVVESPLDTCNIPIDNSTICVK
tara:strand:- start:221 stop:730 length:510 start_codon:yes stop_codon:yes gene_type:complete